jgi:hypothetical protein
MLLTFLAVKYNAGPRNLSAYVRTSRVFLYLLARTRRKRMLARIMENDLRARLIVWPDVYVNFCH